MAATAEIWHQGATSPLANTTAGNGTASNANSATISANDFLTLLVTEMQNQDPTATTDPNEYINQLVNVNSLEQLISINQTLSSATHKSTTGSAVRGGSAGSNSHANRSDPHPGLPTSGARTIASAASGVAAVGADVAARSIAGNLDIPHPKSAALSVARALTRP